MTYRRNGANTLTMAAEIIGCAAVFALAQVLGEARCCALRVPILEGVEGEAPEKGQLICGRSNTGGLGESQGS